MKKRNRSILAHGTVPVDNTDYDKFRGKVFPIVRATIGEGSYNHLHPLGQHPKLVI